MVALSRAIAVAMVAIIAFGLLAVFGIPVRRTIADYTVHLPPAAQMKP